MTVFQDNATAELEQKLATAVRENARLERDHDRLGGLLAEARGQSGQHEKRADLAEMEKRQLMEKLSSVQAIASRAAAHEKDAQEALKRASEVESALASAENRAAAAEAKLTDATARVDELADRVAGYEREIGPFRSLIAALDARRVAEAAIAAEAEKLAGK